VLFGVALLSGLSEDDLARLDHARGDALRINVPWRAGPLPRYLLPGGGMTIVPPELREKLYRAGRMTRACTRPDGRVVQIGDTDSGRLFKLTSAGCVDDGAAGRTFREDTLDHRATVVAIETLFGIADGPRTVDAIVVKRLAGGQTYPLPVAAEIAEHGDLDEVIRSIEALPDDCRRRRYVPFAKPVAPAAWRRAAFTQFGLYTFATNDAFIGFRCAARPPAEAPLGHTHDDNLEVEYVLGNEHRIDPGTVCYTPSRVLRDAYRGAGAHDVPRAIDWEIAPPGSELFGLAHAAWAECLAFGPAGVAGRIVAHRGTLLRALRLTETGLEIWDGVHPPDRLRPVAPQIEVADGYGRIAPLGAS
jgi:Heparinase II/III-like protein